MRIAVAGVGAIGSVVAARLSKTGQSVELVARDQRAAVLRRDGLRVAGADAIRLPVVAAEELQPVDVLFVAVKEKALRPLLDALTSAVRSDTIIIPLVNGIPFWFEAPNAYRAVIVGAAVYITATMSDEGVVYPANAGRLIVGPAESASRHAAERVHDLLDSAGIATTMTDRIHAEVWAKVALNVATNALSVVTGSTLAELFGNPTLLTIVTTMLEEVIYVARAHGVEPAMDVTAMIETGKAAGPFKPSMLQDYIAGRPLEIDGIFRRCKAMAERVGATMPVSTAITEIAAFLERRRDDSESPTGWQRCN